MLKTQLEQKKTEKTALEEQIEKDLAEAKRLWQKSQYGTHNIDDRVKLRKEAKALEEKAKKNQARVDDLSAEITNLEERIEALADAEKVVTKFVDEEGNKIAPEQEGKHDKIKIDKYKWIKTTTDGKGNITHFYKLKKAWLRTAFQIHTLEGKWKYVGGAVIEVKNEKGEVVHTFTTTDEGGVDVQLPEGEYTLTVISVPLDKETYEWKESQTKVIKTGHGSEPFHVEERPFTYYQDTEGNDLADPERGQKEAKEIEGYVLKEKKEARNGCILYIYEEKTEAEEYQIVFNANGGTPTTQTKKVKDGEKVEGIEEPTREGYKFVKWVFFGTDKEFNASADFSKDMLAEGENSLMVVAVWEKLEDKKTQAEEITPIIPGKTEVENTDKLTEEEKNTVKDKIEEAHKDNFPEGTEVDVDDKGNATITYPDGSKDIIPADKLVSEKDKSDDDKPGTGDSGSADEPGFSDDDKPGTGNSDSQDPTKPSTDDKTDDKSDEDDGKDDKEDGKTDAENNPAVAPEKTEVKDAKKLTEEEIAKVSEKVAEANPKAVAVYVDEMGNATLIYADGSMNTISASKLVVEKVGETTTPSKDKNESPRKDKKGNKLAGNNAKTGIGSVAGIIGLAGAAAAGAYTSKKEDK